MQRRVGLACPKCARGEPNRTAKERVCGKDLCYISEKQGAKERVTGGVGRNLQTGFGEVTTPRTDEGGKYHQCDFHNMAQRFARARALAARDGFQWRIWAGVRGVANRPQ
jgi:hypothetical protein